MMETVYNKRHFNFVVSFYDLQPALVNPHCMLRFDCRLINDIATFRSDLDKKNSLLIAACNDSYLRVFSLKDFKIAKVIRSYFGNPLCIDVSRDQCLMAVGFEDDSFVIFGLRTNF